VFTELQIFTTLHSLSLLTTPQHYHLSQYYYFRLTAVFPGEPGSAGSPSVPLHLFQKKPLRISGTGFYASYVFPATQPTCQSSKQNTKH